MDEKLSLATQNTTIEIHPISTFWMKLHERVNPSVPSKPRYGHCNVKNANNRKSTKNSISNFEDQIWGFTIYIFLKNKISIWNCVTIKITISKM